MGGNEVVHGDEEGALTPLDAAYVKLLRTQASIAAVPFAIAALVLESAGLAPFGTFVAPVVLIAAWAIARVPLRRHAARGYDLGADRLRVVRGLWLRSDTVVPFGRVQHIDVTQGPLERAFGLATLVIHTAGTHNASVPLPGLAQADAAAMRESIARHIKRETL
jgi:membrane protein YdbS with pleckstrin-like domain